MCVCVGGGAEIPTLSPAKLIIWGSLSLSVCFIPLLPPPPFAALSPSIPWFYYSLGVTEVSAGVHVYSKQAWQAPHQTEHEKFLCWWETGGYERGKEWEMARGGYDKGNAELGGREREERRAKAEVWDETEQIRVTVSNKGYDTFSTFTFSSSFPFLFVALFLPSFSPTLHLFLHLSPAFVFPRRPKNRSKKKKKKRMRAYITQANYLFHMSAQINKQRSLVCTNPAVQVIYGFSRTSHLLWPLTCCICLSKRYLYCGILIGPKHAKLWACFNSGLLQPRIAALNHIVAVKLWKSFLFEPNFSFHHHFRAFMPDINLYSVL